MRVSTKLLASIVLLLLSACMVLSVSYAWITVSNAPELAGVKITIGIDPTIRIAPNVQETINNKVVNYPGKFSNTAVLETPDALLSPVSTADGVNWFIPTYDEEGNLNEELSSFILDNEMVYANTMDGGYAYLDFWIVSPLDNCYVRLCTGDENEVGTYVVQMPESIKNFTNNTGYNLDSNYTALSASTRVGFLVNDEMVVSNDEIIAYMNSYNYDKAVTLLRGNYDDLNNAQFMIFEPNGLVHKDKGYSQYLTVDGLKSAVINDGEYWITKPIGINSQGIRSLVDITDKLIIQTESSWLENEDGTLIIEDLYQAYLMQCQQDNTTPSNKEFYTKMIEGRTLQYVYAGDLIENSYDVSLGVNEEYATKDEVSVMSKVNAVKTSEIVVLRKNVPQRIRMYVWIEGQDVDTTHQAADKTIVIRLELAGSTGA